MTVNHDAVAALPVAGLTTKQLIRDLLTKRMPYVLTDAETMTNLVAVDAVSGAAILDVFFLGRVFHYDATDTTTAHDGTTCLVSSEGRRYKLAAGVDVFAYAVLDNTHTAPPGSPAVGDAYLVASGGTGAFAGKDGQVAVRTVRGWEFVNFGIGRFLYVEAIDSYYHKNVAGVWVTGFGAQAVGANAVPLSSVINFGKRFIVENQTTTAPPGSPTVGTAYIIGPSATGAWAGQDGKLAICEVAGAFVIYAPGNGWEAYDKAKNNAYTFNGSSWASSAGAVIGSLGLSTDSGSAAGTGGGTYAYSTSTPPTRTVGQFQDGAGLTYTAKATGNLLRFTYRFDTNSTGFLAVAAIFRDSVANALDWQRISIAVDGICIFEVPAPDASSHFYFFSIINAGAGTVVDLLRRRFRVEEFTQ